MSEGFQLNPSEITDEIRQAITQPGWHLATYLDLYKRPDFNTGTMMVYDEVDRAVVVFVGSREEASKAEHAIKQALGDNKPA